MSTELTSNLQCIVMRNGIKLWVEHLKTQTLQEVLQQIDKHKFIRFGEQTINTADITGVWDATTIQDWTKEKNGNWKCNFSSWHMRNEKCACISKEEVKRKCQEAELYEKKHGFKPLMN